MSTSTAKQSTAKSPAGGGPRAKKAKTGAAPANTPSGLLREKLQLLKRTRGAIGKIATEDAGAFAFYFSEKVLSLSARTFGVKHFMETRVAYRHISSDAGSHYLKDIVPEPHRSANKTPWGPKTSQQPYAIILLLVIAGCTPGRAPPDFTAPDTEDAFDALYAKTREALNKAYILTELPTVIISNEDASNLLTAEFNKDDNTTKEDKCPLPQPAAAPSPQGSP